MKVIRQTNERGNICLVSIVCILMLMLMATAMLNRAFLYQDVAIVQKNTVHSYQLAEMAIKQLNEEMNEYLQNIPLSLAEDMAKDKALYQAFYQRCVIEEKFKTISDKVNYTQGRVDGEGMLSVKPVPSWLMGIYYDKLKAYAYQESQEPKEVVFKFEEEGSYLQTEVRVKIYFAKDGLGDWKIPGYDERNLIKASEIKQLISEDTQIMENKDLYVLVAKVYVTDSQTQLVYNNETILASVKLKGLQNTYFEIEEKYEWAANPVEILDSGLTCFSDVLVEGGCLEVKGDIRIKGSSEKEEIHTLSEIDQRGGLIVCDGGQVYSDKGIAPSENRGGIYTLNDVITTMSDEAAELQAETSIWTKGDIIAENVGIYDPFDSTANLNKPNRVDITNHRIKIEGNAFVEKGVKIGRSVNQSNIKVTHAILGISDKGVGKSSTVFNQGKENTLIKARGMYILGQGYIDFLDETGYHKLHESIGVPYTNDLQGYKAYTEEFGDTSDYIEDKAKEMLKDKIEITDENLIYAPEYVCAKVAGETVVSNAYRDKNPVNITNAAGLMYGGTGYRHFSKELFQTILADEAACRYQDYFYIMENPEAYYHADEKFYLKKSMYGKYFGKPSEEIQDGFRGIHAYMTAMRSVFYGAFERDKYGKMLHIYKLEEIIDLESINALQDEREIDLLEESIDLSDYDGKTSLVISTAKKVKLSAHTQKSFRGIILCTGNVSIVGDVQVEGALIVGGDVYTEDAKKQVLTSKEAGLVIGPEASLKITHQPNVIFEIQTKDRYYLRKVLKIFKIAEFKVDKQTLARSIFERDGYHAPAVIFSKQSKGILHHKGVELRPWTIKSVKP